MPIVDFNPNYIYAINSIYVSSWIDYIFVLALFYAYNIIYEQ